MAPIKIVLRLYTQITKKYPTSC